MEVGGRCFIHGVTLASDADTTGSATTPAGIIYVKEAAKGITFDAVSFIDNTGTSTYVAITASNPTTGDLYETNAKDLHISNCLFSGFTRPLFLACIDYLKVYKNVFENCSFDAIRTRKNMRYQLVEGNTFRNIGTIPRPDDQTRDCFDTLWAGRDIIFVNNHCDTCASAALDVKGTSAGDVETGEEAGVSGKVIATGNIVRNCFSPFRVTDVPGIVDISHNIVESCLEYVDQVGIYVTGTRYSSVTDNTIIDFPQGILVVGGSKFSKVRGNTLINNGIVDLRIDTIEGGYYVVEANVCPPVDNDYNFRGLNQNGAIPIRFIGAKNVSVIGNFFDRPNRILGLSTQTGIRIWSCNQVSYATTQDTYSRLQSRNTIHHTDWGLISTRDAASADYYELGDLIARYGVGETENKIYMVGASSSVGTLGTCDSIADSNYLTVAAGFDFSSLSVGAILKIATVRGTYVVGSWDEGDMRVYLDKGLERAASGASVTLHEKQFYEFLITAP